MLLPLIVALAVVWWLSGKATNCVGLRLLSLAIVPVVAFWDLVPTRQAFDWLCERQQGGMQIREVVHDVPGFVVFWLPKNCIDHCANVLAELGYSFVEGTPSGMGDGKTERFRYWLAPEGDASCQTLPQTWLASKRAKTLMLRLDNRCIAREPISAFTADYAYSLDLQSDPNVVWPLAIREFGRRVFDLRTNETLAEITQYENYGGWYVRRFISVTPDPVETCPKTVPHFLGVPSDEEGQMRNVLVPPQRGST